MREILFRGKRIDNGQWVYGDLVHDIPGNPMICVREGADDGMDFLIIPATFGQYTGLKDGNGNRIFEGDIVKFYDDSSFVHTAEVIWGGEYYPAFDLKPEIEIYECANSLVELLSSEMGVGVIGNIHDNPELLERGIKEEA
jgi:uncharacterized phage protein (TIGR01671 family)